MPESLAQYEASRARRAEKEFSQRLFSSQSRSKSKHSSSAGPSDDQIWKALGQSLRFLLCGFNHPGVFTIIYGAIMVILLVTGIVLFYVKDADTGIVYLHLNFCFPRIVINEKGQVERTNSSLINLINAQNSTLIFNPFTSSGCIVVYSGLAVGFLCLFAFLHYIWNQYFSSEE